MNRLTTRLAMLEQRVGPCRECRPLIELSRDRPALTPQRHCEVCQEPIETITVLVAFDPSAGARP